MFNNLTKEELLILGISGVALTLAVFMYAKKKGANEAMKKIEELQELAKKSLPKAEIQKQAKAKLDEIESV